MYQNYSVTIYLINLVNNKIFWRINGTYKKYKNNILYYNY